MSNMNENKSSNPSTGQDKLTRESLRREWRVLRFAWQMAERYHLWLVVALLLELIIGVFPALAIYVVQDAVSGAGHDLLSLVTKDNFILIILLIFVYLLLQKAASVITSFAIIDVEYNIRMRYLAKIIGLPLDAISKHLDNRTAFSMTQETAMTSSLIPMIYRSFLRAPITIISAIVLLMIISPRMLALVTLMLAVIVAISLWLRSRLKHFHREQYDATSSLLQYFSEWLAGNRIFHVYGAEDFYARKMSSAFDKIVDVSKRHKLYSTGQAILTEILTYIAVIVFVVFLSEGNGQIDLGIVISFPALILLIRSEILIFVGGYQQLATTESSISRLQLVLQMDTPAQTGETWNEAIESIELKDLSFGYEQDILSHAQLRLDKGALNVLTGPNGTGKSTTINLLLGLLQPKGGAVLYNGKDIRDYTSGSLLAQFALVEQEPFVFQGTLYDNIALGRAIPKEKVKEYLRAFALDYLIDDELSLALGAKGRALSSGEKQRLALIRALVGEPSVIILDEPTSNIDVASSELIRNEMHALAKEHLVLCVSHDPAVTTDKNGHLYRIENGNYA